MSALVPIKTWLKGETYRAWDERARREGTTIAVLLAHAADRAVQQDKPRARRRWVRVTPAIAQQIADLYAEGFTPYAIAKQTGCSVASIYNHLPKEQG
jgi:DNA invertase Pin-like site-specific DNA recombinase